jgi:hypothetical protein
LAASALRKKKRNVFLGISLIGKMALNPYDDDDPMPKDVMRCAAMARQFCNPSSTTGAEYDTQFGLDFLTHRLYILVRRDSIYAELHNRVSVRRGARGQWEPLSAKDQMLLTELIYDAVAE